MDISLYVVNSPETVENNPLGHLPPENSPYGRFSRPFLPPQDIPLQSCYEFVSVNCGQHETQDATLSQGQPRDAPYITTTVLTPALYH